MPKINEVLRQEDVGRRLREELPRWHLRHGSIRRVYRVEGWKSALLLTTTIGHLCEVAWHHPEILLSFGRVEIRLSTHIPEGITERDLELATHIEELVGWHPGEESRALDGTPDNPRHAYLKRDPA